MELGKRLGEPARVFRQAVDHRRRRLVMNDDRLHWKIRIPVDFQGNDLARQIAGR
jgi:hypothetical protein